MKEAHVQVISPVKCRMNRREARWVQPALAFKGEFYKKDKWGRKIRREYDGDFFYHKSADHCYFYTGHLERIGEFCERNGINLNLIYEYENGIYEHLHKPPYLPPDENFKDFSLRQKLLLRKARRFKRGEIISPTGTGKTILQLGLISSWPSHFKHLILAHTSTIIRQTHAQLDRFNFRNYMIIGAGHGLKDHFNDANIVVSTMQSFVKIDPKVYRDYFNMVIVDEGHRIGDKIPGSVKPRKRYGHILFNMNAPLRYSFTATPHDDPFRRMIVEALIGREIGRMTYEEGIDDGLLVRPRIRIIQTLKSHPISILKNYEDVYERGIVNNRKRNKLIAEAALEYYEQDKSVLILVSKIQHGNNIRKMILNRKVPCEYIHGQVPNEYRDEVKEAFIRKEKRLVIASTVWREGVNIPTLDVLINASGGKSELVVLQGIGRVLRRAEGKDEVIIVDFFDPSHTYLVDHFGNRISIYCEKGWIQ